MSEFADYVEKQQSQRAYPGRAHSVAPSDSGYATESTVNEDHTELNIIDALNLSEKSAQVRLKELLLDNSESADITSEQLSKILQNRLLEGHGEALLDLGQEDNGESMAFSREEWDHALHRIRRALVSLQADCTILMTRNVGGSEEVETVTEKDRSATGKLLIRQNPETIEDVIETRIAVVGNGRKAISVLVDQADLVPKWMRARVQCLVSW